MDEKRHLVCLAWTPPQQKDKETEVQQPRDAEPQRDCNGGARQGRKPDSVGYCGRGFSELEGLETFWPKLLFSPVEEPAIYKMREFSTTA